MSAARQNFMRAEAGPTELSCSPQQMKSYAKDSVPHFGKPVENMPINGGKGLQQHSLSEIVFSPIVREHS